METETKSQLRQFIRMTFLRNEHAALSDGMSLLSSGMMDSTDTLELILYLESEFGITVGDDEAGPENLDTIERIASFIAGKRSGGATSDTR
ncbi:acyl carrier protein [Melittangium boletus]|uniref:Acyl carrier protein n=1 Tax=Melittangium boletus DSM 14713 TaxID=1294270 RepID=A0A250IC88_9BACT|nr:acyl carrier protein [Melittangium boletus]ATB28566.1 acyl carrier protein [Melittangium boletus DSM 14713]